MVHEAGKTRFPIQLLIDGSEHFLGRETDGKQGCGDGAGGGADEAAGSVTGGMQRGERTGKGGALGAAAFENHVKQSHEFSSGAASMGT